MIIFRINIILKKFLLFNFIVILFSIIFVIFNTVIIVKKVQLKIVDH